MKKINEFANLVDKTINSIDSRSAKSKNAIKVELFNSAHLLQSNHPFFIINKDEVLSSATKKINEYGTIFILKEEYSESFCQFMKIPKMCIVLNLDSQGNYSMWLGDNKEQILEEILISSRFDLAG